MRPVPGLLRKLPWAVALALPGALIAYTAFRGGGYYAGTTGALAVAFAVLLAVRLLGARDPLAGASPRLLVAALALGLFAIWTLLSSIWSDAPARAVIDFDRALLYLLTLVFFGSLAMTADGLRWMVRGVALAALGVCAAGLVSRTLPEVLPISFDRPRLGYPIGYSNALGLVGAVGVLLSMHLTSSGREPRAVRILAAGAVPVLASTVYFTFSRGAIAAGVLGVLLYLLLARPRLLLTGLLPVLPASVLAVRTAYRADALSTDVLSKFSDGLSRAALVSQGQHVAEVVGMCAIGAMVARALLLAVDARLLRRRSPLVARPVAAGLATLVVVAVAVGVASSGAPGYVERQYGAFVERPHVQRTGDLRDRLTDPSGSGRADFWRVAIGGFQTEPLHGHGAGTYQLLWQAERPYRFQLFDGHSAYLESLAELGIVGFGLLAGALITMLSGVAARIRGPDRTLFAAVLAALVTWALRAGIDWDWEMPVVTLWVLALGGAALAAGAGPRPEPGRSLGRAPRRALRAGAALTCLVLAVLPASIALSQRHLDESVQAFQRNDCRTTARQASASIDALQIRPEPYELLGYCDVKLGLPSAGVRAARTAVRLDPDNWQYHYALALVRAAAGLDPRASARRALALNPREPLALNAVRAFATDDHRLWRRRASSARLPAT